MILLCLLIALALLQWFDVTNRLQKDQWFYAWLDWLGTKINHADNPRLYPLLALALPLLVLSIGLALLVKISVLLVFLASICLLLYSFGRGHWANSVDELRTTCRIENTNAVRQQVANWLPKTDSDKSDWREQAVVGIAYYAFERTFAVLFWFLLLGPVGAVLYRLSALLQNYKGLDGADRGTVEQWQWLLEWPAIRLLGISFAIVGNFSGCYQQWKSCVLCTQRKTQTVLSHYIQGASIWHRESDQDDPLHGNVGLNDVEIAIDAIIELYNRALLFWVCILAIFWII